MYKIKCNLCGEKVPNTYIEKFYHAVVVHTDKAVVHLANLRITEKAFDAGKNVGQHLADRLVGK